MTGFTKEAVEKLSDTLDEPGWMRDYRLNSWQSFAEQELPSLNDDAWRRTSLRRLKLDEIGATGNGSRDHNQVPDYLGGQHSPEGAGGFLMQVNGITKQYNLDQELRDLGVIFCDMDTAVREHPDLVRKHFMTEAVPFTDGVFASLHGAFWRGGTFLYIPKGVEVDSPLYSALWLSGSKTLSHTLVVVEERARAALIDDYASATSGKQALHNGVIELIVRDNAELIYASLQDFGTNVWQLNHERARVGRDARLEWVTSVMGSRLMKAFQSVELDGQGAWARMSGLFFANKGQHIDLDTQQNHNAPDSVSDLLYKGALTDRARSVWQGMIKVLPGAQRIDGFQANRNLMLSKTARADSIPGLEIEADDVRCTHASTMGQIDQEEIFYLMARGIPRSKAVQMVVQGFFAPVMDRIPFESVRERIASRILEKVGE